MIRLIQVSQETQVDKACLVTGFPYTYLDEPNGPLEVFSRLIRKRSTGQATGICCDGPLLGCCRQV